MPFTPLHMGPGIVFKLLLQGSFSLMVFGWAQIIMDIQPLLVMLTGAGHLHGFSHSYVGATLLVVVATVSGKYLAEFGLRWLEIDRYYPPPITWPVTLFSAFIGCYSHVVLDSLMHADMQPLLPFSAENGLLGMVSVSALQRGCLYSGVVGSAVYVALQWRSRCRFRR